MKKIVRQVFPSMQFAADYLRKKGESSVLTRGNLKAGESPLKIVGSTGEWAIFDKGLRECEIANYRGEAISVRLSLQRVVALFMPPGHHYSLRTEATIAFNTLQNLGPPD